MYTINRQLLSVYKKPHLPMMIIPFTLPLHFLWVYLFVVNLHLEVVGLGIASSISYTSNLIAVIYIISWQDEIKDVQKLNLRSASKNIGSFMRAGLMILFMTCLDIWAMRILETLSATFSVAAAASLGIITMLADGLRIFSTGTNICIIIFVS